MAHIVILGAGTGGMPAAYELRALLDKTHRITVVNAVDYFQFVPSNPWVAVGWRERQETTMAIAPSLAKKGIAFIAQQVDQIDAEGQPVRTDENNYVVDLHLECIEHPEALADDLINTVGVVEHGLFLHMVDQVIVGDPNGPRVLTNSNK